ncbi:MAG: rRNA pseudouridine synthase [Bacteroidales bacterium]|nr:rRNA pseudouridine synthase [Bacteroidales bacterium]
MNQKRNTGRSSEGADKKGGYKRSKPASEKPVPENSKKKFSAKAGAGSAKPDDHTEKRKSYRKAETNAGETWKKKPGNSQFGKRKPATKKGSDENADVFQGQKSTIRLNKYLADAGICSRREADRLIASGVVEINGKVITELGTKVGPGDQVRYGGESLKREKLQYVLLNKPKGFISTSDDPQERKTVMHLVENACKERIYSVGRLDRNTTGLLLFTNDGDLAKKLTHPKHGVRKLYHVTLDKPISKNDLIQILQGVELEDGVVKPDKLEWVESVSAKNEVGIELHSGKNRIVRRIFEHLGYQVVKLDRVVFAGLTKKDLPRGKWRLLTEKEVNMLKMF